MSGLFGFQLSDSAGEVTLRVTDPTMRIIYRRALTATDSGSHALPGFDGTNARAYVLQFDFPGVAPRAEMYQGGVAWASPPGPSQFRGPGELIVVAVA